MKSSYHASHIGANEFFFFFIFLFLTACLPETNLTTPSSALTWIDATELVRGVCFESANDAAGQVFTIHDEAELSTFYDLVDNSQLCRRPIQRGTFDFSDGRIVAGRWDAGLGCIARHDVLDVRRDDQTVTFQLRFITEGDCPYELIRPFWVAMRAENIIIEVVE